MEKTMKGVVLPGDRTALIKDFPVPEPGPGQVLVKMKASTVCGSDIHGIYRRRSDRKPGDHREITRGHPEMIVTKRFSLDQVAEAFRLMDEGKCGKVAVVFDD